MVMNNTSLSFLLNTNMIYIFMYEQDLKRLNEKKQYLQYRKKS